MTSIVTSASLAAVVASFCVHGAMAQPQPAGAAGQGEKGQVFVASPDRAKAMEGLVRATQELRESIQALAQQPPGPKREAAIETTRDALLLTRRAMLQLPAELRIEGTVVRDATAWPKAMARLQEATVSLSDSVLALSKMAGGQEIKDALATANRALAETERAMFALPD